jgi:hypothetical protein
MIEEDYVIEVTFSDGRKGKLKRHFVALLLHAIW